MGTHSVDKIDKDSRAKFVRHLLSDVQALEIMLERGMVENDVTRIGAEQEFCLVTKNWRPANNAPTILKAIDDIHFTSEIARFNLEINLDPVVLKGNCFSKIESQLRLLLSKAAARAKKYDTKIILIGILPTISVNELSKEYMTPSIRYELLNAAVRHLRKKDIELHILGVDELSLNHDSILFEACNTSCQMHLQIAPQDFVASYNWAQLISGPILSISGNSPLLLGRELWHETRIALFQQSVDTRSSSYLLKEKQPRVTFGDAWASGSIVDIYKDDIASYEVMLNTAIEKNSLKELEQGTVPKLKALNLHNGTIYRWNRPCYGVSNNKPHIRIENRYLPSGPSVLDEMANFAFWVGLMKGRPSQFDQLPNMMDFRDTKDNFIKAARNGSDAVMHWKEGPIPARELVLNELLPIAYNGLEKVAIDSGDRQRLLEVIEKRTKGTTGARWNISAFRQLTKSMKQDDALIALTQTIYENQQTSLPVTEWTINEKKFRTRSNAFLAKHVMSTTLFMVNENDLADMATSIMQWKNIHHLPVIDDENELCGLLTWSHMEEYIDEDLDTTDIKVMDIMITHVIWVNPNTELKKVVQLMEMHQIGCLPVVEGKTLLGIITKNDLIELSHD